MDLAGTGAPFVVSNSNIPLTNDKDRNLYLFE